jgi:hypothetical protein
VHAGLREVAPRLGRQAQENLAATANPGLHSRAGQIYATIGGSLLRSAELSGGGGSRKCNAKSGKIAANMKQMATNEGENGLRGFPSNLLNSLD